MTSNLLQELYEQNPWWEASEYFPEERFWHKRKEYSKIQELLNHRFIISILGLRRVGKSTLLKQLLDSLLQQKINPKSICYFSFDEAYINNRADFLSNIIETYFNRICNKKTYQIQEKVYIFLDEVQYIEHWQDILKRYYDRNQNIKFIISGSFSLALSRGSTESLAGRIFEYKIAPLSFAEYLRIKYHQDESIDDRQIIQLDLSNLEENIEAQKANSSTFLSRFSKDFEPFMYTGQFPELINLADNKLSYDYIENTIVDKIISKDIPKIYDIEKKFELGQLCKCLFQDSSSIYEVKNLAEDLQLDVRTCSKFIEILKSSYLFNEICSFSKSFRKSSRSLKKIYASSSNFMSSVLRLNTPMPEILGKLAETYVMQRLEDTFEHISFIRKGQNEIDFVCGSITHRDINELTFIEVKYRSKNRKSYLDFLIKYMKKNDLKNAIAITKSQLEVHEEDGLRLYSIPIQLI